jgi:hypothetical protein
VQVFGGLTLLAVKNAQSQTLRVRPLAVLRILDKLQGRLLGLGEFIAVELLKLGVRKGQVLGKPDPQVRPAHGQAFGIARLPRVPLMLCRRLLILPTS